MAYTRSWSDTTPPGSQAANTIDDEIRNLRLDIHERMTDLCPDWTASAIIKMSCRLFHSALQSIVNSTQTALAWDNESFDTASLHDTAVNNSRITIPTNGNKGIWLFSTVVTWADSQIGQRVISIRKNGVGTTIAQFSDPQSGVAAVNASQKLSCMVSAPTVGDYFEVFVFQLSGGNLNVVQGTTITFFEAIQIL